jgi:protein-disulfide isomerase/ribosomal protein L7/L12
MKKGLSATLLSGLAALALLGFAACQGGQEGQPGQPGQMGQPGEMGEGQMGQPGQMGQMGQPGMGGMGMGAQAGEEGGAQAAAGQADAKKIETARTEMADALKGEELAKAEALDVTLESLLATRKIRTVEQIVIITGLSVGEAMGLVEKLPALLLAGASPEEAAQMAEAFGNLGATLSFKPGKPRAKPEPVPAFNLPAEPKGFEACLSKGRDNAPVTVLEFTDYQCPFCKRAAPTMLEILAAYPEDVRVVVCMLPLSFHKRAEPAARAMMAAALQGKGWEYDALLWENNKALEDADLERYAEQVGLNVARWKADLNSAPVVTHVTHQADLAAALGITGTPNFLVNGEAVRGAKPFEEFKTVIETKLTEAKQLAAQGVPPEGIHARATATAVGGSYKRYIVDGVKPPKPTPQAPAAPKDPFDSQAYEIPAGDSPRMGKGEEVLIVEFSDFQCPYCSRVPPILKDVQKHFGDERASLVFKHFPLSFHKDAQLASEASMAANAQGKFWEMHDKIFENQRALKREDLEKYAEEIGLDMAKFKAALDNGEFTQRVKDDMAQGSRSGVRGTPSIYVNGRKYQGQRDAKSMIENIEKQLLKK